MASSDLSVTDWLRERQQNALRISLTKSGSDMAGWLEDANYFGKAADLLEDLQFTRTHLLTIGTVRRERLQTAEDLLRTFVDDDPCEFDHHGYCQTHCAGEPCSVAQARIFLDKHRHKEQV
jgi:hypothetical protein